jgi:hypothetical protein
MFNASRDPSLSYLESVVSVSALTGRARCGTSAMREVSLHTIALLCGLQSTLPPWVEKQPEECDPGNF